MGHALGTCSTDARLQGTRGERGYTFTEAVVVLSLLGILVAAGVSNYQLAKAAEQVDRWARSMTFDIATGRQTAVTLRSTVTVTLTTSSYLIATSTGTALQNASLPSDILITTTCPTNACSFDRRGLPTAAGTITLTSAATGRSYLITIQPGTGSVSFQ